MNIVGSNDISVLQLQVTFDISGLLPVVNVKNLSIGPNLPGVTWWFIVTSPSGTPIHEGSLAVPDAVGAWSNISLTDSWPRPFNQIEWSGAPYNLTVYAQDSAGNLYTDDSYSATIVRPNGNTSLSKNFYGLSSTNILVKCQEARIYFEDTTSTSYRGLTAVQISSILRVVYPLDPTYSIPPPFVAPFTSPLLVPISYSSNNYQFLSQSVYSYQLSQFVFVNIQYQQLCTFSVLCNIDLIPLVCEVTKLIDSIQNGTCSDVNEATRKLTLINPKLALTFMGIMQPLTGVDVAQNIKDIIEIGNFDCDCCNAPTGIIPQTASIIDGYSFSVNSVCGDITGTVAKVGTNIQFNLQDKSYVFNLSQAIPTSAFTITPSNNGCVKTYTLNVNMVQFGTDLANTILGNAGLLNLWQTIANNSNQFVGDGKCVYTSSSAFTYAFTMAGIPINTTFALATGIQNGAAVVPLNFSLNLTNLPAFQTYLNGLGLGSFVVTNPSGQNVLISSAANPNVLSQLTYSISAVNFIAGLTSSASGYVPVPNNTIIQAIINRICGLTDSQVVTSQDYVITYVDGNGDIQTIDIPAGTKLSDFIADLIKYNTETVGNISLIASPVTCKTITAQFDPKNNSPIGGADFIMGTRGGGACAQVAYLDAFKFMLNAGQVDAPTKALFCQFVASCGAGLTCAPYDFFEVLVTNYNTACSEIVGIEVTLS